MKPNRTNEKVAAKSLWPMICCVCKLSENDSDSANDSGNQLTPQIISNRACQFCLQLHSHGSILIKKGCGSISIGDSHHAC